MKDKTQMIKSIYNGAQMVVKYGAVLVVLVATINFFLTELKKALPEVEDSKKTDDDERSA